MMKTNILILAAAPAASQSEGSSFPLCLTEMDGVSLIEKIVQNTREIANPNYIFAFLKKEADRYHLDKVARLLQPAAKVVSLTEMTQGSACTALLSVIEQDQDSELLVISANEYVDINFAKPLQEFRAKKMDGGVLTFRSLHPRYSYVRINDAGLVTEAAQQNPISNHATAGVFWFAKTADYVDAAMSLIRKKASTNNKYYIAPAYNELVLKQAKIGTYPIENSLYHPLKNERQAQQFETGTPVWSMPA